MDELGKAIVKLVETEAEMQAALAVRFRVFVDEQEIAPEEEIDSADATAIHAIAICDGRVVGTGRLILRDAETAQIGRMAVDLPWRRGGVGGQILGYLEDVARSRNRRLCILHAPQYIKAFYVKHGYGEWGHEFIEANIPHIEMQKEL